jgi:DNA modification methylase
MMDRAQKAAAYLEFLREKIKLARFDGFDVPLEEINPALKPHTRDIVRWMIKGGNRAVFASFGLHKTATQLEFLRVIGTHRPGLRLQVLPLGVRQEFFREVQQRFTGDYAIDLRFIRSDSEIGDERTIYLTNYESVREGKVTPGLFRATSLDEASILRSYGSKTYQEFLPAFAPVEFKAVATATPDPNRYKELIHYAGYLGVMDTGQALTRFFQRDSEKAGNLTLYPHKEQEFWLWVASWAVFITKPSDLGHDDTGYVMPELDVRWHEIPSDYATAGEEKNGQGLLVPDLAMGLSAAAREKRDSMPARVAKVQELVQADPADHFIVWHDLEDERHALQAAIPEVVSVWGSQDLEEREARIIAFSDGEHRILSTKPVIAGSGCNFQRHCHREVFAGIGFKFNDFIQACHRVLRFGQQHQVRIDIIHTESERAVKDELLAKWRRHDEQQQRMAELVRRFGLDQLAMQDTLARTIGIEPRVVTGDRFEVANNDCVMHALDQPDSSVDLIVTSIPFANHYEYTPSYNDFGHTEDNAHFWRQMDFLTPELLRILRPGRLYCCHVKDRINFGNVTGAGIPTVSPFHAEALFHGLKHGFDYMGMITIVTDVVRENNQTYRLGYTEMCKDGTKMGVGSPEYVLLFHKPQSDRGRGYADVPVKKSKPTTQFRCTCCEFTADTWAPFTTVDADEDDEGRCPKCGADGEKVALERLPGYSLARWQVDAHAFWRSSGNRLMSAEELAAMGPAKLAKFFTEDSLRRVYDYEQHVAIGEQLLARNALPSTFMSLAPGSHHPDVWHDVNRMRTLNNEQSSRAIEKHVCPLQFDIVDRLIERYSVAGEVVYDPFHGLGTVGVRAIAKGRLARGSELSTAYFADQLHYLRAAEREVSMPSLFDALEAETAEA